jgi:sigma-E factor negative regulatory protein RseC
MSERIFHEGVIDHIESNNVFVRILSKSACSACHAKSMCTVSEMTEKLVEVKTQGEKFNIGQSVNVIMDRSLGTKAVLLGYFLPFLIMIATLLITSAFLPELFAGLLSISILFPYFLLLYLFKDKMSKTFSFHIEKT